MATLDERLLSSYPVLARLGRTDTNGIPIPNRELIETSPDLWRIIGEACFGTLWNRPALTIEQRSLATISVIAALCRDDNLKGHVASGLDLGLSPEQIVEIMLQLIFYTGAPIATTAMRVAHDVFEERGIQVQPTIAYDTAQAPDELYRRGLAQREAVLGEVTMNNSAGADDVDRDWERYMVEYLWGAVWTRPALDIQSRMICALSALSLVGTENALRNHVRGALRIGLTEAQVNELFFHLTFYTGVSIARKGKAIAQQVFNASQD